LDEKFWVLLSQAQVISLPYYVTQHKNTMNFELIKSRVQASAVAAAEAARNFKSLDQMAADDEYIHSEGLKTSSSSRGTVSGVTASMTNNRSSLLEEQQPARHSSAIPNGGHDRIQERCTLSKQSSSVLLSIVEELVNNDTPTPGSRQDDSDSEEVNDSLEEEYSVGKQRKKKNPTRFMEDLDERLSKAEQGMPPIVTAAASPRTVLPPPSAASTIIQRQQAENRWSSWMKSTSIGQMVSSRVLQVSSATRGEERKPIMGTGLLSRKSSQSVQEDDNGPDEEHVVLVSSSVLGDEERAELERIKLVSTTSNPLTLLLSLVKHHPHHAFIAFTLVLAFAAYFYSRHRGSEDDVT
jgi:hypothetical protein